MTQYPVSATSDPVLKLTKGKDSFRLCEHKMALLNNEYILPNSNSCPYVQIIRTNKQHNTSVFIL